MKQEYTYVYWTDWGNGGVDSQFFAMKKCTYKQAVDRLGRKLRREHYLRPWSKLIKADWLKKHPRIGDMTHTSFMATGEPDFAIDAYFLNLAKEIER